MKFQSCRGFIQRRQFLSNAAIIVPVIAAICNGGCDPHSSPSGDGGISSQPGSISNNHGHSVVLNSAQQVAGDAVTLILTQGDGHTHTLELTADQVKAVANGNTVTATSSVDADHSHNVTFRG